MLQEPFKYFILVAKHQSFAKAAKELYMSTPAITQRINALEDSIGFKLFIRSNKGVLLTKAGEAFLKEAERISADIERAVTHCSMIFENEKRHLSIGASGLVSKVLLPLVCKRFSEESRNINYSFVKVTDPVREVLQGMVDINITYGNIGVDYPDLENTTIFMDEAVCLVPKDHHYADKKYIRIEDLYTENIGMPTLNVSAYHRNLYSLLKKGNPSINVFFSNEYQVSYLNSLATGSICILPKSYNAKSIEFVEIPFETFPYISIDAITKIEPGENIMNFISTAKAVLNEQNE